MRKTLDLYRFVPFRMNRLAAEISEALAVEYRDRYGLDVPEWRVIATLGFRGEPCTAQEICAHTHTHKSTISRAVSALIDRGLIKANENGKDRREVRLTMTAKGRKLYQDLIPRLLDRESNIMNGLSEAERKQFDALLKKIESGLSLPTD